MVLVEVSAVVVLTTGQTTTTGVLAVLANTSVTGGDVSAATERKRESQLPGTFGNEDSSPRIAEWQSWWCHACPFLTSLRVSTQRTESRTDATTSFLLGKQC